MLKICPRGCSALVGKGKKRVGTVPYTLLNWPPAFGLLEMSRNQFRGIIQTQTRLGVS